MTTWVGTSWKMNKTLPEALAFAEALAAFTPELDDRVQPFVIPSFTAAREVKRALAHTRVRVGAQNMHWADAGAWTGEVSALQLRDCGLDLVELGHSERREHFGETDATVGLKTEAAVRHGLVPLICVGETLPEREAGRADAVLAAQTTAALAKLDAGQKAREILFAYEPVWAIGEHGIPATADYADAGRRSSSAPRREVLGREPQVLYGGSVNPGNAAGLVAQPHIDGLFIGRSAWDPAGYIDILKRVVATLAPAP